MKKIVALLICVAMLVSFGCATQAPSGGNAPAADAGDKKYTIAMISHTKGNEYFLAADQGAKQAAEELGVDYIYDGPAEPTVDLQIEMINNYMTSGIDALCVAPLDTEALAPTLSAVRAKGIPVITYDVDTLPDARDFYADPCSPAVYAKASIDAMVEDAGTDTGKFVIMIEYLTDVYQYNFQEAAQKYAKEAYPNLELIEVKQVTYSQDEAYNFTNDYIRAYPDLIGISSFGTIIWPGIIEAVRDAGKVGVIGTEGGTTPLAVAPYLDDGSVKRNILWDVANMGYVALYAAYQCLDGTLKPDATSFEIKGKAYEIDSANREIFCGEAFTWTAENVHDYNY